MNFRFLSLGCLSFVVLVGSAVAADKMKPGSYPEREAAWKKFTVKDVTMGTPVAQIKGFVCDAEVDDRGYGTACVKFLDDRCKNRPTKVKHVKYAGDAKGQGCLFDSDTAELGEATYLDGVLTSLSALSFRGTPTDVPRVYAIHFTFALEQLTDDSNIGKALIAKYGKPDTRNPPNQMVWNSSTCTGYCPTLNAYCSDGPPASCKISVDDLDFSKAERAIQDAFNAAQQKKSAPAAPKL